MLKSINTLSTHPAAPSRSQLMTKMFLMVSCVSSQEQQKMLLRSLLGIVGNRRDSGVVWSYADEGPGDVIFVDYDDAGGVEIAHSMKDTIVVAFSRDPARTSSEGFNLHKPLRSKDLIDLLDRLGTRLAAPAERVAPAGSSVAAPAKTAKAHEQSLLAAVLGHLVSGDSSAFLLNVGKEWVYFDLAARRVQQSAHFSFAMAVGSEDWRINNAAPRDTAGSATMSIADFFYEYSLKGEAAILLDGMQADALFSIRQWPLFRHVDNTRATVKLSAYFSRRKASLAEAAEVLDESARHVAAYLNAAHAQRMLLMEAPSGSAVREGQGAVAPAASVESKGIRGLFKRIRSKLGI